MSLKRFFDVRLIFLLLVSCSSIFCCSLIKTSADDSPLSTHLCFREAHKQRATSVVVQANGDCVLCKSEQYRCGSCANYELVSNPRALLMRTRAESNVNPYDVFTSSSTNQTALGPEDLAGTTAPYKSPLFGDVSRFNHVIVELLLGNGTLW